MPFILQPPEHPYAIRSVGDRAIVVAHIARLDRDRADDTVSPTHPPVPPAFSHPAEEERTVASPHGFQVLDITLAASFYLTPESLHENWSPRDIATLQADDLAGPLALDPEVILLGTGSRQGFPAALVMATCLRRGVGIEAMTNAAAARTFSVLASEGRRVVAAFLLG